MRRILLIAVLAVAVPILTQAQELKPLLAEDKAKVEELLKAFDPKSFDFRYQYTDPSGKVQPVQTGKAKGLANLRQRNTLKVKPGSVASTNTNINIFSRASTNTNINIFRQASTNTNINLFKDAKLQAKALELNAILQKYYVEKR